jgi:anhydro-N-acetylmuramic acid kinase
MRVIGLMSGTSADAIDAILVEIAVEFGGGPADAPFLRRVQIEPLAFVTIPWGPAERAWILRLFAGDATPADLCRANFLLGERFAEAALAVVREAGLAIEDVALIGSHGQTIWHDVDAQGRVTSTLQIGEPSVIAERTGVTTVADFRVADVAAGGQGAPLTSTLDWLMLRPPSNLNGVEGGWRALQNIGGIGNVTFLPPVEVDAPPLAFDTGPGNALIDWAAGRATGGNQTFDHDGQLAAQGAVDAPALAAWLAHPYFQRPPPKTTGRELFGAALAETWQAESGLDGAGLVATLTELTAASIAEAYAAWAPGPVAQVVVSGGGARNPTLMARLRARLEARLGPVDLCTHDTLGLDGKAKEAAVFALLAFLTVHGLPGNVPACTGAYAPRVLGKIAPGYRSGLHRRS